MIIICNKLFILSYFHCNIRSVLFFTSNLCVFLSFFSNVSNVNTVRSQFYVLLLVDCGIIYDSEVNCS